MTIDENDKAIAGELPEDLESDTVVLEDGPRLVTSKELLAVALKRACKERQKRGGTTGNKRLDEVTGGLRAGFTWVLAAETSWGKSSWCVSVADENLKSGARVLIVSTEDAPSVYGDRLLARRARLNAKRLRDGALNQEEVLRATEVVRDGEPIPVYLDAIGKPVEWIANQLPRIIKEYGVDIVIVDYLQEIRSKQRHQDRRLELSFIAGALRACIKRAGCAGVLCSQITKRDGQAQPNKYSVRDSQDVANGAEVVVLGYTPERDMDTKSAGKIEAGTRVLLVDKNKDGSKGVVPLVWDEESACFRDTPDAAYSYVDNLHDDWDDFFDKDAAKQMEARQPWE